MCLLHLGEIGNDSRLISVLKIHDESIRHTRGPSDQKSSMSTIFFAQERRKNEAGAGASWENDCKAIEGRAGKNGHVLHQTASDSRFGTRTSG